MPSTMSKFVLVFSVALTVACGPAARGGGEVDGGRSNVGSGDGGNGSNCGTVTHPEGTPIDLPDGVCGANGGSCTCTTDANCGAGQKCWAIGPNNNQCRLSYVSTVSFSGFGATQKVTQPSDIVSVCVNMSHEWIRDLEIDLVAPSGQVLALDKFEGQMCPTSGGVCQVFLGNPLNTDGDCPACTAEMGMQYCWTPTATKPPILKYADMGDPMNMWNGIAVEPPDNYAASDPWTNLVGATLNGTWTFRVTDLWPTDAGKLHGWTISFNPAIVQNCSTPPIQ